MGRIARLNDVDALTGDQMGMLSGIATPPWKTQKQPGLLPSLMPNFNPVEAFKTDMKRFTVLTGSGDDQGKDSSLGGKLFGK